MPTRREVLRSSAALPLAALPWPSAAQPLPRPVTTASGTVAGIRERGVSVFRGIPYAASTAGAARFLPPGPAPTWPGVRDCTQFGPSAPQPTGGDKRASFDGLWSLGRPQGEDCLVLNVWTPAADDAKRPVMVWLHGGGFVIGSGSSIVSDGTHLARREDVVVVTLNHRLGVMGYLDLGLVDPDFAGSVNAGMLDIVAALRWVRQNIAAFGGDPSRVMIFGESGGSLKVATLMAMPAARGLFHAAAMESGAYVQANTRAVSTRVTEAMLRAAGVAKGDVRRLQQLPLATLLAASSAAGADVVAQGVMGPGGLFASTVDGETLPRHPFDPDPSPLCADIPLIIGSNRTETTYIAATDRQGFALDPAGLELRIRAMFPQGDEATRVLGDYRRLLPEASPSELYYRIGTDQWLTTASRKIAERKALAGQAPAYLYRFDWRTPVDGGQWRSPHTIEIPFVFQTVRDPALAPLVGPAPDIGLAARVSGAWAALARTGRPGAGWPAYDLKMRATMIFDSETRVASDPDAAIRRLLDPIVFATSGGRGDRALAVRALMARPAK